MTNMELMLESYMFPDGKSKLKFNMLTEAEKKVFTKNAVTKLFKAIKNKSLRVNYMGLERTKGDVTAYPKYEDVENAIKILNNMYKSNPSDAPKEILSCVKVLDILKKNKDSFQSAFSRKNDVVIILYVNIYAALIAGASKLVAATIEYIKQPTGEYKAAFKKESKSIMKDDAYFTSLDRFITIDKNGQLKQLLNNTNKLNEDVDLDNDYFYSLGEDYTLLLDEDLGDFSFSGLIGDGLSSIIDALPAKEIGIAVLVIVAVVYIVGFLPYHFYKLKKSLSDHLLNLAYFLEEHTYEIDTSTEKGKAAKEKQLKIVEKLKTLGNALSLDDKKAKKEAEKEQKEDEEEAREEAEREQEPSNDSSDDDVLL